MPEQAAGSASERSDRAEGVGHEHRASGLGDGARGSSRDRSGPSRAPGGRVEAHHTGAVGGLSELVLVAQAVAGRPDRPVRDGGRRHHATEVTARAQPATPDRLAGQGVKDLVTAALVSDADDPLAVDVKQVGTGADVVVTALALVKEVEYVAAGELAPPAHPAVAQPQASSESVDGPAGASYAWPVPM